MKRTLLFLLFIACAATGIILHELAFELSPWQFGASGLLVASQACLIFLFGDDIGGLINSHVDPESFKVQIATAIKSLLVVFLGISGGVLIVFGIFIIKHVVKAPICFSLIYQVCLGANIAAVLSTLLLICVAVDLSTKENKKHYPAVRI